MLIVNIGAFTALLNPVGIPHIAHTCKHSISVNKVITLDQSIQFLLFVA